MDDNGCLLAVTMALLVLIGPAVVKFSYRAGVNGERAMAVDAGVAEYYIDEDREKAFRYTTPTEDNNGQH